jgi:hypothetical protein
VKWRWNSRKKITVGRDAGSAATMITPKCWEPVNAESSRAGATGRLAIESLCKPRIRCLVMTYAASEAAGSASTVIAAGRQDVLVHGSRSHRFAGVTPGVLHPLGCLPNMTALNR